MEPRRNRKTSRLLLFWISLFFALFLWLNFNYRENQEFIYLSRSFLQGNLFFTEKGNPISWDTVYFNNHYYWPLGVFPAFLIIPFVFIFDLFGMAFYQGYLQFFLGIAVFLFVYRIAHKLGYQKEESILWGLGFCFGSMFIGVYIFPSSYYFAHVITVFFLCWIIWEHENKNRWWLIGLILACLVLTRLPAAFGATVWLFINSCLEARKEGKTLRIDRFLWMSGLALGFSIMAWYNFARFGKAWESGYSIQTLYLSALSAARSYGVFSPVHIPGNLYYSLLATPLPVYRDGFSQVLQFPFIRSNRWGMSIFITSPYLITLFYTKLWDKKSIALLTATIAGLSLIYTYYGIGYIQFGYRYFLDVFPWLFYLLIYWLWHKRQSVPGSLKILLLFSPLINLYMLLFP